VELSGVRFLFLHATPKDPLYQYLGPDPDEWAAALVGIDADVVVVGHTHLQFDITVGRQRVVNPGSVGQPKDGDPRAAYAVIENGSIALRRVAYPVGRTVDALRDAGVVAPALDVLETLLRTGSVELATDLSAAAKKSQLLDADRPEPPAP
jgi:diadenosine tetraphosphatase ApaH/serine/threonine PP2A family protein phosphatase